MKEDNKETLQLKERVAFLEREVLYQSRVVAVLQAVGIVTNHKLEQAREIVSGLAD